MDQSTSTKPVFEGTSIPTTSFISSGPSISYDFFGPLVPVAYQCFSGIFSGASTSPLLFHYPPWTIGMPSMHDMFGTTLLNIGQISQTTIAPISSTQPISSQQLPLTSGATVQSSLGQSIPTNMGQMSIGPWYLEGNLFQYHHRLLGGNLFQDHHRQLGGNLFQNFHHLLGGNPF